MQVVTALFVLLASSSVWSQRQPSANLTVVGHVQVKQATSGFAASCTIGNRGFFVTSHQVFSIDLFSLNVSSSVVTFPKSFGYSYFCWTAGKLLYIAGSQSIVLVVEPRENKLTVTRQVDLSPLMPPNSMGQYYLNGSSSVYLTANNSVVLFTLPALTHVKSFVFPETPWTVTVLPNGDVVTGSGTGSFCVTPSHCGHYPELGHLYAVQANGVGTVNMLFQKGIGKLKLTTTGPWQFTYHSTQTQKELGCWDMPQNLIGSYSDVPVGVIQQGDNWVVYDFLNLEQIAQYGPVAAGARHSCLFMGSEVYLAGANATNQIAEIVRVALAL